MNLTQSVVPIFLGIIISSIIYSSIRNPQKPMEGPATMATVILSLLGWSLVKAYVDNDYMRPFVIITLCSSIISLWLSVFFMDGIIDRSVKKSLEKGRKKYEENKESNGEKSK